MSSPKLTTMLCMVSLLLFFFSITCRSRPDPAGLSGADSPVKFQHVGDEAEKVMVEESCEGVGEEECLMRRTLAAHIDYIYTQKDKP